MNASVNIRLATTDDAPAISDLILRTLHEVNIKDYGPALIAEQSKNWTVDGVVAKMQNRITYVAVEANDIVGTAGFDGRQARTVFVRPDQHKLGIGSLLIRAIEALAIERGLDQLSLLSSITAQGFYKRLGYTAVRDVYHGAERTVLMQKRLAAAEG
jgi:N-acetylglutamate synthase-like GNAT family acetyltransferase